MLLNAAKCLVFTVPVLLRENQQTLTQINHKKIAACILKTRNKLRSSCMFLEDKKYIQKKLCIFKDKKYTLY